MLTRGGLNIINVIDMQKSFLITWVKKIACNPDAKYSAIPCHYYEELGMDLSVFDSNVPAKHFQGLQFIKSTFWSNVLLAWLDTKTTTDLNSIEEIDVYNQVLWNNNIIRYKGKSLMFKPWISAGYVYVGDLFLDDVYLTLEQLEHKYSLKQRQEMKVVRRYFLFWFYVRTKSQNCRIPYINYVAT